MGPHLHACGDSYSVTPNLDKLASSGLIYMNAWSNAPVCAPARTTIISGVYPPSTGSEHMRSMTKMPAGWKMFPGYLRDAGYYCSNNVKEDYNLEKPAGTWDDSSKKGHWRNRAPGQPFFSVFNLEITHESQIRKRPHTLVHDPAKVRIPAYHPDTPEVRHDWAQYYDNITTMDGQAGRILADLKSDGLADDTIVFFFGDHGSGMPRSKRWPYNSGLNVSILAAVPEKWKALAPKEYAAGRKSNRLVSFVDLAPTMLSLAGLPAQTFHQGYAFMGRHEKAPRQYSFGFRGRMDERYDCVRSVRNDRYVYVRNYMPHKIYGQHLAYMWETPTTPAWERLYQEGKLNAAQKQFWEKKPVEEMFDLQSDPDEVKNLADSAEHRPVLEKFRAEHLAHERTLRDVGLLPEDEIHGRAGGGAPYAMGHDERRYPAEKVLAAAQLASSMKPGVTRQLLALMKDGGLGGAVLGGFGRSHARGGGGEVDTAGAAYAARWDGSGGCDCGGGGSGAVRDGGGPAGFAGAVDPIVELREVRRLCGDAGLECHYSVGSEGTSVEGANPALPVAAADPSDRGRADNFQKLKGYLLEEVLG
ncbi:MAG: sulfatase [Paludibaculum sp.]